VLYGRGTSRVVSEFSGSRAKKRAPPLLSKGRGQYLATTYSHRTCRPTTIGAAAFHFRVRNGTGWFHRALVTRGQSSCGGFAVRKLGLWGSGALCQGREWVLRRKVARSLTSTRRVYFFRDARPSVVSGHSRSFSFPIPKIGIKPNG
jgi:hypothetical protein